MNAMNAIKRWYLSDEHPKKTKNEQKIIKIHWNGWTSSKTPKSNFYNSIVKKWRFEVFKKSNPLKSNGKYKSIEFEWKIKKKKKKNVQTKSFSNGK